MIRSSLAAVTLLLAVLAPISTSDARESDQRPNIILIMPDDVRH